MCTMCALSRLRMVNIHEHFVLTLERQTVPAKSELKQQCAGEVGVKGLDYITNQNKENLF